MAWTPPRRRALAQPLGKQLQRHLSATLLVTDDYGDAVGHSRRCPSCRRWMPLDLDHFGGTGRDETALGYQRVCRPCERAAQTRRVDSNRDAVNRANRASYHQRMMNPAARERAREQAAASYQRRLQQDPERMRALDRERGRRYRARVKADPVRLAARRDHQRIDRVLRAMRNGASVDELAARRDRPGRRGGLLPVAPLYERAVLPRLATQLRLAGGAIARDGTRRLSRMPDMACRDEVIEAIDIAAALGFTTVQSVADDLGVSAKTIQVWVRGQRPTVRASVVDEIMTRTGLLWWDLVSPGDPAYDAYRAAFGGDELVEGAA